MVIYYDPCAPLRSIVAIPILPRVPNDVLVGAYRDTSSHRTSDREARQRSRVVVKLDRDGKRIIVGVGDVVVDVDQLGACALRGPDVGHLRTGRVDRKGLGKSEDDG